MPLVLISFFGDGGAPIADAELDRVWQSVHSLPSGCVVKARALDRSFLEIRYAPDQPPSILMDDATRLPPPLAPAAIFIWMDEALDNLERATQQIASAVHDGIGAITTGTFDARCHLDLVGSGARLTLQALAVIERCSSLDRDSFMQYYRTHHVPLAKRLKPKFLRYTTFRLLERIGAFTGDCVSSRSIHRSKPSTSISPRGQPRMTTRATTSASSSRG